MERALGVGIGPLAAGTVGLLILLKVIQRLRRRPNIQDKVVVITGASSGLGKECARVFHAAGARLILCGRDQRRLQEVVEELGNKTYGKTKTYTPCTVTFDLSNTSVVCSAAAEILKRHGHVDVLINIAGVSYRGNILDTHVSVQREVMETNYFGPVALTQAILPSMVDRGSGHIVVISSVQGKISIPYRSAYAASKHAMQAYYDCLRAEVDSLGLHVSVLSPGYVRTNMSINAVTGDGSKYGVMDRTTATGADPVDVAKDILKAVCQKKKDVVMAGLGPTTAIYLRTLWPALYFRVMASRARKQTGKEE
uniref:Peroxisomal reductase activating PPAR-gamma n=1 Tax=Danio rerio TaxID=7955 RepID=PEXRP_DANRE|nr:dehydrogenase/reductase SDR family member 7B [Danio rerio]Q566S6.1 RecName: Full=Dehydrogenase/reductase SDR family member 7B; AltName: Full=Short-chain dehydrogenase/reductase family 32C member 1; Short=Protein SDR32C1 [Danio rerio]AAH93357.1 Dehydrogenase/reductase (SDR family) member 7B [Danio rerio]|eukprot:NP_001017758.1 dehydrogenase/reductase SDR family member 7B [Danio rerio]